MARLNLKAVEERVAPLGGREAYDRELIFDLLLAYGKPKGNVTRLRTGSLNVAADAEHEVAQKNVVYFRETTGDPLAEIEELRTAAHVVRYNPRFVIVTDYTELLAVDTKTSENLVIPIRAIDKHFTFFLPWAGMEKAQYVAEAHADVKAAERMGKLFDELLAANPDVLDCPGGRHALNVFFTRLLFCFFAEDTGIFAENQFTNAVGTHTQVDGSDVDNFLRDVFAALDTADTAAKAAHLASFPYVNGRLFTARDTDIVPRFSKKARQLLIDLGTLIWQEINPDIFGSMFQAIVTPGKRADLGQHYTSVPNILKTIEPLFLDDLKAQLDAGFDNVKKLEALLDRISTIKVFDPACGSGNFLVIAYKELRRLEHAILERLSELDSKHSVLFVESRINIENFYGIEIDDFAVEVAILSLWIAKHQMNAEFKDKFGVSIPLIPLKETGQIHVGNAARVDWNKVCPNDGGSTIYLIGNPPYVGASKRTQAQRDDLEYVIRPLGLSKKLNYISVWFIKGIEYLKGGGDGVAFVTTKTIAQGEHVSLLFPFLLSEGVEIGFAYPSFQWGNNARSSADVTVAVIGFRRVSGQPKHIFTESHRVVVSNINGYLADSPDVFLHPRRASLSGLPLMEMGAAPVDGGNLLLDEFERYDIVRREPDSERFIRRFVGSEEFINDILRHCLWVNPDDGKTASSIPPLADRFAKVAAFRKASSKVGTRKQAGAPYRFGEPRFTEGLNLVFPSGSSGLRRYIPTGYLSAGEVLSKKVFVIPDAPAWVFALLVSAMHMAWVGVVSGRMRINYQYSNTLVYNNFPVPPLSHEIKEKLALAALRVLDVREYHCEKTLAELYDPDKMPDDLCAAHKAVDDLVDSIYSKKPYGTDEQRLSDLFALYEKMAAEEEARKPAKRSRK